MTQSGNKNKESHRSVPYRSGFISVLGKPNVGKSTLVNNMVGQKIAIISEKPQTTRTKIMGILTRDDAQLVFLDTPGIHHPHHKLGEMMVETAWKTLPDADAVLFLIDGTLPLTNMDRQIAELLKERAEVPIFLLINKSDAYESGTEKEIIKEISEIIPVSRSFAISALTGEGVDAVEKALIAVLPEGPKYYPEDEITDQQERVIAAELVREQVLLNTRQEIPHAVAVVVQDFKERDDGMIYINATIYVEKDSQKGIIIGKDGQMLKAIGGAARKEIERMVDGKVFLQLWVKLRKDWRKKEPSLREMGYRRE